MAPTFQIKCSFSIFFFCLSCFSQHQSVFYFLYEIFSFFVLCVSACPILWSKSSHAFHYRHIAIGVCVCVCTSSLIWLAGDLSCPTSLKTGTFPIHKKKKDYFKCLSRQNQEPIVWAFPTANFGFGLFLCRIVVKMLTIVLEKKN